MNRAQMRTPGAAGLPPSAVWLLFELGRFGYLTYAQAAARSPWSPAAVSRSRRALGARGWLTAAHLYAGYGRTVVYALSPAGHAALRGIPGHPPCARGATPGRIDQLLAAVDLARELEAGGGSWVTWEEYRRGHAVPAGLHFAPAGLLEGGPGPRPVWLVLRRVAPGALRESVRALYRRPELQPPEVWAWPEICPGLEAAGLLAPVRPWTPPHLRGRTPLSPGWSRSGARARSAGVQALGPRRLGMLRFLGRFGYATVQQLARDASVSRGDLATALLVLERRGLVQRQDGAGWRARPDAWSATAAGLAAIGSVQGALPARPQHRRHSLALVDLAQELEAATGGRWEAERELGPEIQERFGRDPMAPPDGRLTLPGGRRVLVQLQLSKGHPADQYRYAWRQRVCGIGDEVWFVCAPAIAPAYRRALQPAESDFIDVRQWTPPDHSGGVPEHGAPAAQRPRRRGAGRPPAGG